VYKDNDLLYMM